MDYNLLVQTSKKIKKNRGFIQNRTILINPIDKYNFVIEQYNQEHNIVDNTLLKKIYCEKIYSLGYIFENGIFSMIIFFFLIPGILFIFNKLLFSESYLIFQLIFLVYFSIVNCITVLTLIMYIYARIIFNKNQKIVNNPFIRMILMPEMCRLLNVTNKHFELDNEELEIFNFSESQKKMIKQNVVENRYCFMIYDQNFVDYYSEIKTKTLFLKHITWVLLSLGLYIIFYFFI